MYKRNSITGSLQTIRGRYYAVINLYVDGKRKRKSIFTGYKISESKTKANLFLQNVLHDMNVEYQNQLMMQNGDGGVPFIDFMRLWLSTKEHNLSISTFQAYSCYIEGRMQRYFSQDIKLYQLSVMDVERFYASMYKDKLTSCTVLKYHRLMKQALDYAVKRGFIEQNIMKQIDAPRDSEYTYSYYSASEVKELLQKTKEDPLHLIIMVAAYYGLRRSEILGLRWESIDFENNAININHKILTTSGEHSNSPKGSDILKTKSAYRSLPLLPIIRDALLLRKSENEKDRKYCGRQYSKKYLEYIFVDEHGILISPEYVTRRFPLVLDKLHMKKIRFHDLRHTCASLLFLNEVPLQKIQLWLGHSTYRTTEKFYIHLDFYSHQTTADAIDRLFT